MLILAVAETRFLEVSRRAGDRGLPPLPTLEVGGLLGNGGSLNDGGGRFVVWTCDGLQGALPGMRFPFRQRAALCRMLRGCEVRVEEGVATGHMPCPCSLLSESSCFPGTLGPGCMLYISVDIGFVQ